MVGWSGFSMRGVCDPSVVVGVALLAAPVACSSPSTDGNRAAQIAADGGVAVAGGGTLTFQPKETCVANDGTTTVMALGAPALPAGFGSLAVDAAHLYVAVYAGDDAPAQGPRYYILSATLPCSEPKVVVERPGTFDAGLLYAEGRLFWIADDGVLTMPVAGGAVRTLAPREPVRPVTSGGFAPVLTVRSGYVFWADLDGSVSKVPVAGGPTTTLASGFDAPGAIAVNDTDVYWTSVQPSRELDGGQTSLGEISRVSIDGGPVTTIATGQEDPDSLLLTATDLYWANAGTYGIDAPLGTGAVVSMPLSGSAPAILAPRESAPRSLQLVGDSLYWMNRGCCGWGWIGSASLSTRTVTSVPLPNDPPPMLNALTVSASHFYWIRWRDTQHTMAITSKPRK
jgi:hypothetical protein